jgi:hypothetical protein
LAAKKAKKEKERFESPLYQAKLLGEALRGTVALANDALDILRRLRSTERLLADFGVNDSLMGHLLKPHILTEHMRNLIARMDPDKASLYADVKQLLLYELKLCSSALLDRFNGLIRNTNETFTLYGSRFKSVILR